MWNSTPQEVRTGMVNHVVATVTATPHEIPLYRVMALFDGVPNRLESQKSMLFLCMGVCRVQDNELWIISQDAASVVGPSAPYV
jgi:hypothetical protein